VKGGRCVDTTMGLTPSGGLVMSTRTGDIDPGVILYLQGEKAMSLEEVNDAINNRGGLLGVSGISADMLELLGREAGSPRAKDAVQLYCYQARKFIASLASTLNGVDTVVFTAGIGENSPEIRRRIMAGLEFMGIELDSGLNLRGRGRISSRGSKAAVWVIGTDEEVMIARKTFKLLRG
ncbi:MAG TPA: acetate/propionate family kinase, partial [Thermodesulfobacteriota bacterium]|nr:acetate/propionate family kinase [Thermodesulfobacteriota bacterium]